MSVPLIVGLTELEQPPWADVGASVMTHALASDGFHVVLLNSEPCSAVSGQWTATLSQDGPSSLGLMRSWRASFAPAPQGPLNPWDSIGPHPGELRGLKDQDPWVSPRHPSAPKRGKRLRRP